MSIKEIIGEYIDEYEDIIELNEIYETNKEKYYEAYNKTFNRRCILKVIDKKKLEDDDFDFLMEQIIMKKNLQKYVILKIQSIFIED